MNADDPVMRAFGGAFLNRPGLGVNRTFDSVNADDLALLESDPAEFFRRTHKPMPTTTVTGPARMTDEINQIKADPRAYFSSLLRPERLKPTPTTRRRFARWLLHVADRVEHAAYKVDDRAWAVRWHQ